MLSDCMVMSRCSTLLGTPMNPILFAMMRCWWMPFVAAPANTPPPKPLERDEPDH